MGLMVWPWQVDWVLEILMGSETVPQRQSSPPLTYLWQRFQRLVQQVLAVVQHHVNKLHVQAAVGRRQLAPRGAVLQQGHGAVFGCGRSI